MLLAGSLREYPFSLLLEIFLRRKETGLLEVSSTADSGYFYIKNGKVKDGQLGTSKGLAAIKLVEKFDEGSFRFKSIEPTDYARIVWQRSFGPTGSAIGEPALSASSLTDKLAELGITAAAIKCVVNDLRSLAHQALRQFLLYTSITYRGLQKLELFLRRRTVTAVMAGIRFWRRARIGTRLRQMLLQVLTALLIDKRRRARQAKYRYPRIVSFEVPTVAKGTRMTATLQQGLEHNVIFVLTLTVLFGMSGLLLYGLALDNQHSSDTGITVDEQLQPPADAARTTNKPKRPRRKRPPRRKVESKGKP